MSEQVYKAYSLLTEKSFEEGDAVIRGFATTPTPDRVADVVVPEGVVFRTNDIKLRLYHDTRMPVGQVSFGKPTKKGIPFEARLPDVKEDGTVRERVNEARHSIKYNLISAVSIGFRALEGGIEIMKNGGYKFNSWEMIELSLTSVPANPEAVITAMKSIGDGTLPRDVIDAIKATDRSLPEKRNGGYVIRPVRQEIKTLRNPDGSFRLRGQ
jgi:HK97 family phage prohead protease